MRIYIRHACMLAVLWGVVICCPVGAEAVQSTDPVPDPTPARETEFGGDPYPDSYNGFFGDQVGRDDCDEFGREERQWFLGGNRYRGNVLEIQEPCSISEFRIELTINSPTTLYFYVHKLNEAGTAYVKIWDVEQYVATDLGRRFYSSGDVLPDDGLALAAGEEYALGAAWIPSSISYWRDNPTVDYPQPFSKGMILGAAMVNSAPPLDSLLPGSSVPWEYAAASMDVCYRPIPGACCDGTSCEELLSSECMHQFTAPGVTCADVDDVGGCPLPVRACCCADYTCVLSNEFTCEDYGCDALEIDSCTDPYNPCEPIGACCNPSEGTCSNITETMCTDAGWIYRGNDTACDTVSPPCHQGACCFSGSVCWDVLPGACLDGVFLGLGTTCADEPCNDVGACCLEVDTCADAMTRYDCMSDVGTFLEGVVCATEPPMTCGECDPQADDCDDGLFCNGTDTCINGICVEGASPCDPLTETCDQDNDVCLVFACVFDIDCDDQNPCTTDTCNVDNECEYEALEDLTPCSDDLFCNGAEVCMSGVCEEGTWPCEPEEICDEDNDVCIECLVDEDCDDEDMCTTDACVDDACVLTPVVCDDDLFCNGLEECDPGTGDCVDGVAPCVPQYCDEDDDICRGADMDADGDVDLEDFALWQACFEMLPVEPECLAGDIDGNGTVDLDDFADFVLTGP